jgi:hypothetical protein
MEDTNTNPEAAAIWFLTKEPKTCVEEKTAFQKELGKLDICLQKIEIGTQSLTLYKYHFKVQQSS